MNNNKKYFIPDIEDIRVGYECELYLQIFEDDKWLSEDWIKGKVTAIYPKFEWTDFRDVSHGFPSHNGEYKKIKIRTLLLIKEQIEQEGWEITFYKDSDKCHFTKKDIECFLHESNRITIVSKDYNFLYKGECKSINEFRYICKLLEI